MNGTAAYLKVYPESSYDAARANSARLIAIDSIRAEIDRRIKENQMSADEALARLADMASGSHADFTNVQLREDLKDHTKAHLVKTVTTDVFEDKMGRIHHKLKLELYDAQAALRDILRIQGKFKDTQTNLNLDLSQLTDVQLQRIAAGEDPLQVIGSNPGGS